MAIKLSVLAKDAIVNGLITTLAGTTGENGTAAFYLYTFANGGVMPADADSATQGTLVCTMENIWWSAGTGGTASLRTIFSGTAAIEATIGWGRFRTTQGDGSTACLDGTAGTGATNAFVISNDVVAADDIILLTSAELIGS